MNTAKKVILKNEGDIGILQINNPPENYLEDPEFMGLEEIKRFVDTGIKALVIEGVGRHFSAGANLEVFENQVKDKKAFLDQLSKGNKLLNYIDTLNIPVLASISGVCFGAGLEIALTCDIRIAEENSFFAFPEVNHNMFPGLSGTARLAELTSKIIALELVLYGDMINAEKAIELGIIDEVVSRKKAIGNSVNRAIKMTNNRPLSVINAVMSSVHNSKLLNTDDRIKADIEMFVKLAFENMNQKTEN